MGIHATRQHALSLTPDEKAALDLYDENLALPRKQFVDALGINYQWLSHAIVKRMELAQMDKPTGRGHVKSLKRAHGYACVAEWPRPMKRQAPPSK